MTAIMPSLKKKAVNGMVYLSQGFFSGKPTWHYILVDKLKLPILLNEVKKGEVDLQDYGRLLFSGFGEFPPDEVSSFVNKKYGTN